MAYTVVNYCKYQSSDRQNDKQHKSQRTKRHVIFDNLSTGNRHAIEEKKEGKNKRINNTGRFEPPDVETVKRIAKERGNKVDPQAFVDFYESKGWMDREKQNEELERSSAYLGRKKTRGEARQGRKRPPNVAALGFNNFTGRDYDMDQMERALGIPGGGNHAD